MYTHVHSTIINVPKSATSRLCVALCALLMTGCAGTYDATYSPDSGGEVSDRGSLDSGTDEMAQADGLLQDDQAPSLAPVGATCSAGAQCQSGNCADGYCCDKPCSGTCLMCDVSGAEGLCTPMPANTDPDKECQGERGCGGDVCDGLGKCTTYKKSTTLCKASCNSSKAAHLNELYCDGAGKCSGAAKTSLCAPFVCKAGAKGANDSCAKGCEDHADCVAGSVCDRSAAHKTGLGVCVDPIKVVAAGTDAQLFKALLEIERGISSKTHVFLTAKSYKGGLFINNWKVTIVGRGQALTSISPELSLPAFSVLNGGDLTLQGVKIHGSKMMGVGCDDVKVTPRLTLLESRVENNSLVGVFAGNCHVELRRNEIFNNKWGGIRILQGGVVVNNVIVGNGSQGKPARNGHLAQLGSPVGGALLLGDAQGQFTFENNTVSDNKANIVGGAGVRCQGISSSLKNNIVWNGMLTKNDVVTTGCNFIYSNVQGLAKGKGCISSKPGLDALYMPHKAPQSPCIDAGATSTQTVIDLKGSARPAKPGGKVDLGAFEVK